MTVVSSLDTITAWAQREICSKVLLKVPPSDETAAEDAGYEYKRVHPTAFSWFVPTKEKLPPAVISPFPSVCVRFLDGADTLAPGKPYRSITVQLFFSTWDPGTHGKDILLPDMLDKLAAQQWIGTEAEAYFRRCGDGWRDAWNMVDIALREVESVTNIDGLLIDRSVPVKFGPLTEQEAIPDLYPFWFAWVSFAINTPITRNLRDIQDML